MIFTDKQIAELFYPPGTEIRSYSFIMTEIIPENVTYHYVGNTVYCEDKFGSHIYIKDKDGWVSTNNNSPSPGDLVLWKCMNYTNNVDFCDEVTTNFIKFAGGTTINKGNRTSIVFNCTLFMDYIKSRFIVGDTYKSCIQGNPSFKILENKFAYFIDRRAFVSPEDYKSFISVTNNCCLIYNGIWWAEKEIAPVFKPGDSVRIKDKVMPTWSVVMIHAIGGTFKVCNRYTPIKGFVNVDLGEGCYTWAFEEDAVEHSTDPIGFLSSAQKHLAKLEGDKIIITESAEEEDEEEELLIQETIPIIQLFKPKTKTKKNGKTKRILQIYSESNGDESC